jgi:hypothetical protein
LPCKPLVFPSMFGFDLSNPYAPSILFTID